MLEVLPPEAAEGFREELGRSKQATERIGKNKKRRFISKAEIKSEHCIDPNQSSAIITLDIQGLFLPFPYGDGRKR